MADEFKQAGGTGEHQEWIVVSRVKEPGGFPVSDRNEMWETFYSEAKALYVGAMRTKQGYWVDAFQRIGFSQSTDA